MLPCSGHRRHLRRETTGQRVARGAPSLTSVHGLGRSGDKMIDRVWSPRVVACGRSVSQGRPGRWALAAGGLGEPAAEHLRDEGALRVGGWSGGFRACLLVCRLIERGESLLAEFAQDVVGAPAELAGNREAGARMVEPRCDLQVVAAVG